MGAVVLPCEGAATAAAELSFELVADVDAAATAARSGREVLAFDACGAACRTRLLRARGIAARTIGPAGTHPVPRRPAAVLKQPRAAKPHTLDEYLLAIDRLTFAVADCGAVVDGPTLAAHVAHALGVSRATAGEMLARLLDLGLVRRGEAKELLLTSEGRATVDRLLRRLRILECFVATLGYLSNECRDRAGELARGFDDDAVERLWATLGRPRVCPHGWPIDAADARATTVGLRTLAAVPPHATVVVDRVDEANGHELASEAILHDVVVGPERVDFVVDHERRSLPLESAGALLVRAP